MFSQRLRNLVPQAAFVNVGEFRQRWPDGLIIIIIIVIYINEGELRQPQGDF
jgi:hypothetical protein